AANGDTRLYLAPGADSLAAAWAKLLAPLIRPLDSLPRALRAQLPFPVRAFRAATAVVERWRTETAAASARPREPFEVVAPRAGVDTVYLAWGEHRGQGRSVAAALRSLLSSGGEARAPADTALAARWRQAQQLAAEADAALAAGNLERFGQLYRQLRELLGRGKLAPTPQRR